MTPHLIEPAPITAAAPAPAPADSATGLAHLPVSLFTTVMGIDGTALAWQRGATALGLSPLPGRVLAWAALASAFGAAARPGASGYRIATILALTVVSMLVAVLTVRTLIAIPRGGLCRPEPSTPSLPYAGRGTAP